MERVARKCFVGWREVPEPGGQLWDELPEALKTCEPLKAHLNENVELVETPVLPLLVLG